MNEPNFFEATVFVHKHKATGEIAAHYMAASVEKCADPDWEHVDTLEPRAWIQEHYASTERKRG